MLGVSLFGAAGNDRDDLNRHTNFENFGSALLTLLKVGTGEDWTHVMEACVIRPPDCSLDNADRQHGCVSRQVAYPFFITFMVVGNLTMLNLFMAVRAGLLPVPTCASCMPELKA